MKGIFLTFGFGLLWAGSVFGQELAGEPINAIFDRVYDLAEANQTDSAKFLLKTIIPLINRNADEASLARYHSIRGFIFDAERKWHLALTEYGKAVEIQQRLKAWLKQAKLYVAISWTKEQLGDFKAALQYAENAVQLAEKNDGDAWLKGLAYNRIAISHRSLKNYEQARMFYGKATRAYQAVEDIDRIALIKYNISELYFLQNQFDSAKIFAEDVLAIINQSGDNNLKSSALNMLASIHLRKKEYTPARERYRESEVLAKESRDSLALSDIYLNLSLTELYAKNYEQAKVYQQKSLQFSGKQIGYEAYKRLLQITGVILSNIQAGEALRKKRQINQYLLVAITILAIGGIFSYFKIREKQRKRKHKQEIDAMLSEFQVHTMQQQLSGEKKERKRVAKVLHDTVGSQLAATRWLYEENIEEFKKNNLQLNDLENVYSMLIKGHQYLQQATSELKKEENFWLRELENFCTHITRKENFEAELNIHNRERSIDAHIGEQIKNMVLTLTANVLKHAKASKLWIIISLLQDKTEVVIEDNGQGFNPNTVIKGDGLVNVERRIKQLKGNWKINSEDQRGTTVYLSIPRAVVKV